MDLQMLHDVIMHHLETFREETLRTFENVKGRLLLDLFNNHLDVLKYKIDAEWEKIVHVKEEAMELQSQESNTALFEEACSTRNFSNRETVEIHENNDNSCKDDAYVTVL